MEPGGRARARGAQVTSCSLSKEKQRVAQGVEVTIRLSELGGAVTLGGAETLLLKPGGGGLCDRLLIERRTVMFLSESEVAGTTETRPERARVTIRLFELKRAVTTLDTKTEPRGV